MKTLKLFITIIAGIMTLLVNTQCSGSKSDKPIDIQRTKQVGWYETYNLNELSDKLIEVSKLAAEKSNDTLSLLQLLALRVGNATEVKELQETPVIGNVLTEDTATVSNLLRTYGKDILYDNLWLCWTAKPQSYDSRPMLEKMNNLKGDDYESQECYELIALKRTDNGGAVLSGDCITKIEYDEEAWENLSISIALNEEGAKRFSEITKKNTGRSIAAVLGDKVISFGNVIGQIDGGSISLAGNFTKEEAQCFVDYFYGLTEKPFIKSKSTADSK